MLKILLERISPNESICMEDEKESKSASVEETADTDFLRYNPCLVTHYNDNNYYNKEDPTTTWTEQRALLNCCESWLSARDKIHVLTGKEIIAATPE